MTRLFDLDLQLLADAGLMMIAVFALFLVLSHLLFNPARKMLQGRQEKIKNELDTASKDMADAAKLKADYKEKLSNINAEAEEILADARKKAIANEARIILEAKEDAARIIERAKTEAQLEKEKVADDIKKEMISVATLLAGKVVASTVNTTIHENLINETLKEIGESTWLS